MSRSTQKVSVAIETDFFVTDNAGVAITGLVDGGFTKRLSKDGANDTTTVTITEIANGRYKAVFTPGSTGFWQLTIIHATYNPFGWEESWDVTTDGQLTSAQITAAVPTAVQIRTEIDSNSTQLAAILTAISGVAAASATAVWGFVVGSAYTAKRYLKAIGAAVAGKTTGGPSGFTARDLEDTQDQVVGTADSSGNRTPTSYGN